MARRSARVTVRLKKTGSLEKIAKSQELGDQLEPAARRILESASEDPNEAYVESLRMSRFVTPGRRGRIQIIVGAHPVIGTRVEAKRGTLSRAVTRAGF